MSTSNKAEFGHHTATSRKPCLRPPNHPFLEWSFLLRNLYMPTHKGLKCCSLWAQKLGSFRFLKLQGGPPEVSEAGTTNGVPFCRSLSFTLCGYVSWRVVSGRGVLQVQVGSSPFPPLLRKWCQAQGCFRWVSSSSFSPISQKQES